MEVLAKLRFLRMAPRKIRLVVDTIRGLPVEQAEYQLAFLEKKAAVPVLKLLKSAMANAENNFKLKKDNLYIKKITVDQGPTLKRWQPRAFGRAAMIRKKSSHITVVLDELKSPAKVKKAKKQKIAKAIPKKKKEERPIVRYEEIKREAKGKEEARKSPTVQKKKPLISFKNIKDRFTRRLGE